MFRALTPKESFANTLLTGIPTRLRQRLLKSETYATRERRSAFRSLAVKPAKTLTRSGSPIANS